PTRGAVASPRWRDGAASCAWLRVRRAPARGVRSPMPPLRSRPAMPVANPAAADRRRARVLLALAALAAIVALLLGGFAARVRAQVADGRIAAVERLGGVPGARAPDVAHPPRIEPAIVSLLFDDERTWRTYVSLARVPVPVREAIVTSEDRRFRTHVGVDL